MASKKAKKAAKATPKALTARQSRFVVEYLKDQNGTQAAIRAGYAPATANREGCRLLTNAVIAAAVAAKQERVAKKAEITVDTLAKELEQARGIALKEKQSSAAVQATMGKAKLFGLGVENRRLSGTVQVVTVTAADLRSLTKDELHALAAAIPILEKIGLIGGDSGEAEGD